MSLVGRDGTQRIPPGGTWRRAVWQAAPVLLAGALLAAACGSVAFPGTTGAARGPEAARRSSKAQAPLTTTTNTCNARSLDTLFSRDATGVQGPGGADFGSAYRDGPESPEHGTACD